MSTKKELPKPWAQTQALLEQYPAEDYNRLLPTSTIADVEGQFHNPVVEVVRIDSTLPVFEYGKLKKQGSGEVYQDKRMPEGTVALARRGLEKFCHAAGVQFPPQLNEVAELIRNPKTGEMTGVLYKAAGAVKKADGSLLVKTASKLVDLELEEIKARAQLEKKNEYRKEDEAAGKTYGKSGDKIKAWTEAEVDAFVRRDVIQARENMVQNAETKAQNRVLRKILALKDSYTVEELSKPFVLIRFDQVFNLDDPRQSQLLLAQAQVSGGALYGEPMAINLSPAQEVAQKAAGPPAGQEVTNRGQYDLDTPPSAEGFVDGYAPSAIEELVALGYEGMKDRFVAGLDVLTEGGLVAEKRDVIQMSWKLIHNEPEPARDELFAALVLEVEEKGASSGRAS